MEDCLPFTDDVKVVLVLTCMQPRKHQDITVKILTGARTKFMYAREKMI